MRPAAHTPLTHRERLARGLARTAAGPVDVTRGAVGLGAAALREGVVKLYRWRGPWVIVGGVAAVLLAGGAAMAAVRRTNRPQEPSPRPPSVESAPRI